MLTGKYNLSIQAGESVNQQFKLLDANGAPFDLTGYSFDSQVRTEYNSPTIAASFTVTASAPVDGIFAMSMNPSSSASLTGSCYYYDVRMTTGSVVTYPMEGKVVVSPRVTR